MPVVSSRAIPWPENAPYDKQSVQVPGTKRPGQTAHYRNGIWGLIGLHTPNAVKTLDEIFDSGLSGGRDRPFLGARPVVSTNPLKYADHYVWQTYGDVDIRRRHVGSALSSLFAKGEVGGGELNTVGIWSANRPEWQIIDIALQSYDKVSVSLYDTLGKDSVEYIINHAHLTVIFSTADHIPTLLKLAPNVPILKLIVCIDDLTPEARKILTEWGAAQNIKIQQLRDLEAYGKTNLVEPTRARPETIVSICYTSGTTNNPKGVVLTHGNFSLATQSNLHGLQLPEEATLLSYLPLAHIYERVCELCVITVSGKIGYFTGDPLRLLEDAQLLKPNFFPSVPRVLNRVYQAAMAGGNVPGLKGNLFRQAIKTKLDKLHATGDPTHFFWDKLVFRKIQAVLGGQIQLITSGSAPISPDVMDFLKIAFACDVTEG
ncbi:putative AMP-binding enzyme [Lyophyllum shimeji]|uniref:AMP-binding enzyme n=1 Tax=Lyophyllum shimeji TaxID=47721 RepID=A0A9P3UJ55_LYOSH|nr:putative AMP-binding enzyme [Lyophyllum shimeji]